MEEIEYKNLIPKFSSQEELECCGSVKISCEFNSFDGYTKYNDDVYKMFDGDDKTFIKQSCQYANYYFEFNQPKQIKKFSITASINNPRSCVLYVSNDNITWETKIFSCGTYGFVSNDSLYTNRDKTITDTGKYRYFKLHVYSYYHCNIHSIELFTISNEKILIKQDKSYLIIQPDNFFGLLTPPGDELPTVSNFNEFGLDDLSAVCSDMTVGDETFKPIDKIKDKFNVIIMKKNIRGDTCEQ